MTARGRRLGGAGTLLALVLLNAALSYDLAGPPWRLQPVWRLSIEGVAVLTALAAWAAWAAWAASPSRRAGSTSPRTAATGPRPRGVTALIRATAVLLPLGVAVHTLDVLAPLLFGRPLHLVWDLRHAGELLHLAAESQGAVPVAAGVLALALLLGATAVGLARLTSATLDGSWRALQRPAARIVVLMAGSAGLLSYAAYDPAGPDTRWLYAMPFSPTLWREAQLLPALLDPQAAAATLPPGPDFPAHALDGLRGADVLLMFAESYGAATLDRPEIAAPLQPDLARFALAIAASGRQVVSARLRSPTFGGGSWLAHASLLSGRHIDRGEAYEALLSGPTGASLVGHFQRHGWRTVGWMPGLQKPWPEGRWYGYDRLADAQGIGYRGPPLGYWRIPDQAALALLQAQELAGPAPEAVGPRQPRFAVFPTLGTHAPFRPRLDYQPDWTRLLGPSAYDPADVAAALAAPVSWTDATGAYVEALQTQFDVLGGYLRQQARRDLVLIVVGDHQPMATVSGRDASWDVPVHVIADDARLLDRLRPHGFVAGLRPAAATAGELSDFTGWLLEAFDPPAPDPSGGDRLALPPAPSAVAPRPHG